MSNHHLLTAKVLYNYAESAILVVVRLLANEVHEPQRLSQDKFPSGLRLRTHELSPAVLQLAVEGSVNTGFSMKTQSGVNDCNFGLLTACLKSVYPQVNTLVFNGHL